jgi:membrane protein involved in colicin uptake
MAIKESIKSGVNFTVDTVSEVAAIIAEKNRLRSQLNHIKKVIKTDSATRDQAYIELGRFFYENLREDASPENEAICAVIDSASERISAASLKYMEVLNQQNELKIRTENTEKIKKIIAEKAADSAKAAKEKGAELGKKAKELADKGVEKAKDIADGIKNKANDTVDDVKEHFDAEANAEVDQIIAEEQAKVEAPAEEEVSSELEEMIAAEEAKIQEAQEADAPAEAPAEESPEAFDF